MIAIYYSPIGIYDIFLRTQLRLKKRPSDNPVCRIADPTLVCTPARTRHISISYFRLAVLYCSHR